MNNITFQMLRSSTVLVAGAGGFIGGWLVRELLDQGFEKVRAVDIKPLNEWYQRFDTVENLVLDLRNDVSCGKAVEDIEYIFNLACNMGGMGFIELNRAECMLSVLINTNLLHSAKCADRVKKYLFTSSACVYNADKQTSIDVTALKEEDAYPAQPEDGYGWEKLFSERMCRHFYEDFNIETRVVRLHNVYGPHGTWFGGREKAPAALCRKAIYALSEGNSEIEIWGDGEQRRSFMYIDDCIEGIQRIFNSDYREPLNLGSDQLVSINGLLTLIEGFCGTTFERAYNLDAPKGVRGRNSDNDLIKAVLGWAPGTSLSDGMKKTYDWIDGEIRAMNSRPS